LGGEGKMVKAYAYDKTYANAKEHGHMEGARNDKPKRLRKLKHAST
jgi:hypothetical protein